MDGTLRDLAAIPIIPTESFVARMKISVVLPVLKNDAVTYGLREEYLHASGDRIEIDFLSLEEGTRTIESAYDLTMNAPDVVRRCVEAERAGADAAIIACFGDPGLEGARSATALPIVGEGEAALHMASLIGKRCGIVTVGNDTIPLMRQTAQQCGFQHKLVSVRSVLCGVLDFDLDRAGDVVEAARRAVLLDHADVIVLGCTGVGIGLVAAVKNGLEKLHLEVPLIDPSVAALALAEAQVRYGFRPSRRAFCRSRWTDNHSAVQPRLPWSDR